MNKKQVLGLILAAVLFAGTGALSVVMNTWSQETNTLSKGITMLSGMLSDSDPLRQAPDEPYIAIVRVEGTIMDSSESIVLNNDYHHSSTLDYIDALADDEYNAGILLYIDSPGGRVYETDELYLSLVNYRTETSRPVYSYFGAMACSGGYYAAMAAQDIAANRNCWTGSIGVITQLTDLSGLYKNLGIQEVNIVSGENKAMGSSGTHLTAEQRKIFQSIVDEAYEQFVRVVADGRQMSAISVREAADGRIYTAKQAQALGLVDHISSYEEYQAVITSETGVEHFYEPEPTTNWPASLLQGYMTIKAKSEAEILLDYVKAQKSGVWYYAEVS